METPDIPRAAYAPSFCCSTPPLKAMSGPMQELVKHGPMPLSAASFTVPPPTESEAYTEYKSIERSLQILHHRRLQLLALHPICSTPA